MFLHNAITVLGSSSWAIQNRLRAVRPDGVAILRLRRCARALDEMPGRPSWPPVQIVQATQFGRSGLNETLHRMDRRPGIPRGLQVARLFQLKLGPACWPGPAGPAREELQSLLTAALVRRRPFNSLVGRRVGGAAKCAGGSQDLCSARGSERRLHN